jgi:methylmalonyl-CoA/ethylmalonyl-CoA epimerase
MTPSLEIEGVDHIGIVVDNLDEAKHLLGSIFGLALTRETDLPNLGRKVAFFQCGLAELEVIEIYDPPARARELGDDSARIQHVALRVRDVRNAVSAGGSLGVRIDGRGIVAAVGRINAWTEPESTDGIMFQLTQPTSEA